MARLVGGGVYHRSDHGSAVCGAEARRPRARETERMRPCRECYPPSESGLGQRKESVVARAPEMWAAVVARSGGSCEIRAEGCWRGPVWPHHRLRQGQGGPDTPENIVAACDVCHRHVHHEPEWSYRNGLLIERWQGAPTIAWVHPGELL